MPWGKVVLPVRSAGEGKRREEEHDIDTLSSFTHTLPLPDTETIRARLQGSLVSGCTRIQLPGAPNIMMCV